MITDPDLAETLKGLTEVELYDVALRLDVWAKQIRDQLSNPYFVSALPGPQLTAPRQTATT